MLIDLQPRVCVLSAHVVHRLGETLDHARQLALPSRHEPSRAAEAVLAVSEPALARATSPRADHVLRLRTVDRLESLIEPAQRFDRRRELLVVWRVLLDVLHESGGVSHLRPAVAGDVARDVDEVAEV